jgi:hypothetical protein
LIFLYCYIGAVFIVVSLATLMECQGLRSGVSGANGFVWMMLSYFMGLLLIPTTLITWWFTDGREAFGTLAGGAIFLAVMMKVTMKIMVSTGRAK